MGRLGSSSPAPLRSPGAPVLARALVSVLAPVLCGAPILLADLGAAQVARRDPELQAHLRSVRAERTARLRDAFRAADPAARLDARLSFEARRSSGAAALAPATLEAIAHVTGELDGSLDDDASDVDERAFSLARSLDLRVRPGLFAARDDGLGELTLVTLAPLWPVACEGDVLVELHWVDGRGERELARREPFAASVLRDEFEMAVRPPASEPSTWWLEPVVEVDRARARGVAVRVSCADEPREEASAAAERLASEPSTPGADVARRALAALVPLHDEGRRDSVHDARAALDVLAAWRTGEPWPPATVRPLPCADAALSAAFVYEPTATARPARVVALVVASHAAAAGPWLGTDGERLRRLADEHDAIVVTLRLADGWAPLEADAVAALRALAPDGELVLVAMGDAAGRLPAEPVDALALCAYWPAAPPQELVAADGGAERPLLVVSPLADAANRAWAGGGSTDAVHATWVEGEREPALWSVPLFEALDDWLAAR